VLAFNFEPASPDVAVALQLAPGDEILHVRRVTYAGDEPFGLVTTWVPAEFGRNLSRAAVEQTTLYDLLPLHGVEPVRATQTITAVAADAADARALQTKAGTPLLAFRRVTYAAGGRAVVLSEHRYPGHRTSFDVEFGLSETTYPSRRHLRSVGERHG
jgi:GntR family transcriptional regulator